MLTRVISGAGLAAVMAALAVAGRQSAAQAGGGPGGGNPFGSVVCGQSYSPSCAVSAGSPGKTGAAGARRDGQGGAALTSGDGGSLGCSGTPNKQFGCVPAGCQITVATLVCPLGVPGMAGRPGAAPPAPGVLAQFAVRYLVLPSPVIRSSPPPGDLQLTWFPTWLWVSPAVWLPRSRTASVPGESVTATATPVMVTWRMGDGSAVTCPGPGTPYSSRYAPSAASPDCGHTYTWPSAGQPSGAYQVTVTITWDITWRGTGGAVGVLRPLFSTATAGFRVAESQAVNTSGGR